jgi:1-acyl-sn-glycerol-3-phosphate acyltransferase
MTRFGNACLRWVKITWLAGWVGMATFLVFPPITLVSLFSRTGDGMFHLVRLWAWIVCRAAGVRIRTRWLTKIDRRRSYIIIVNHQSHLDGPVLALGLRGLQFRWIAKRELLKIPLFGHCLHAARNIFIDRANRERAIAGIREGLQRLPGGVSVVFFAEGSRSDDGRLGPFKKGGFAAAIQSGLPILPVVINGSRRVLPKGSVVFRSGPVDLIVGTPIETTGYGSHQVDNLMRRTRETIEAHFKPSPI